MRDVLETVDEFSAASLELVAWELTVGEDEVRPDWSHAVAAGWLRDAGVDEWDERLAALTPLGQSELRRLQRADGARICRVCGRVSRADGICGRCGTAQARPAGDPDVLGASADERLLIVVRESCSAYEEARGGADESFLQVLRDRLTDQAVLLRVRADAVAAPHAPELRALLARVENYLL